MTGVNEARDLAFDDERNLVWVADYRNNRVFAINREGRLKRKVTGVELPERLAVDAEEYGHFVIASTSSKMWPVVGSQRSALPVC